ncbi:MAG: hypothetical protein HY602_01835 [Parcubacteria group bacterium]|nr:hypothetical protein [Parcubacteria group bacterium]
MNHYIQTSQKNLAWVVSADMGYGHARAAHCLRHLSYTGEVINSNNFEGISTKDRFIWKQTQTFYEFISRFKNFPVLGEFAFDLFDKYQKIESFYPRRDLSVPNFNTTTLYNLFRQGWLLSLKKKLQHPPLPIVATLFIPALAAEYHHYSKDIYCVATDTDINRAWAPYHSTTTQLKYFAPTQRVAERLILYGVPKKNIYLTGFPLPKENIGGAEMPILKKDLGARLYNLDPRHNFFRHYLSTVHYHIGVDSIPKRALHPLTLLFSVGGAGAQKNLGAVIIERLAADIARDRIKIILGVGARSEVNAYYQQTIEKFGLSSHLGRGIEILYRKNKKDYFEAFNNALRRTDILWTKPSELSFYTALGIPIIMAPSIGSQEDFNREWLKAVGGGITQNDPRYVNEWLFDWLNSGWLAKAAMEGFLYAPKMGTYNIEAILLHKELKLPKPTLVY